jgi:tRNA A-37 threonylcarbamoyl transferase component Bud32/TolB-like protein
MSDSLDRLTAALHDRYRVEHEIGAGGMATVYRAHDVKHDRKVAVKVLRPELAAVLGGERFLTEIQLTANLQHPHILPLFDSGEADGFLYYVMPYVDGESLRDKLNREYQLPIDETVKITTAIASALEHAHRQGVIHRDIKPENILLKDGQAVVADFGIALAVDTAGAARLTETGFTLGTPEYMSPEQAVGDRHLNARSDVYALAAVVYEMLTGEPPHTGKTAKALIAKLLSTPPVPLRTIRDSVPEALDVAVRRALSMSPADRQASAQRFAEDVERGGTGGSQVGVVPEPVRGRFLVRRVAYAAAAAIVIIGSAGLLVPRFLDGGVALDPNKVAVAPFENNTGDAGLNAFGGYAAELIMQGIHATPNLAAVPSDFIRLIVNYLEREQDAGATVDPVRTLARETGAGLVIMGSYYLVRDSLQVQAQIIDAESGELVSALAPVSGPRDAPDRVVEPLRSRVMGGLSFRVHVSQLGRSLSGADPPSWEAFREAHEGDRLFRSGRLREAIGPLERAATMDSGQAGSWALILLGTAHRNMGTDAGDGDTIHLAKADSILRVADGRRDRLSLFQIRLLDNSKALVRGDYVTALRVTRDQAREYPRSLAPFGAGYDALFANRPREAAYWFESVDPDAPAVENWGPYWFQSWVTYHRLGDYRRQRELLDQYRERHPNRSRPNWEITTRAASGEYGRVMKLLDGAFDDGLRPYVNRALLAWSEFRAHEYPALADSVLAQAVERYQNNTADAQSDDLQRGLHEAQGNWEEARHIAVRLGPGPSFRDSLNFTGRLGVLDARIGNRDAALATSRELQALTSPYMLGRGTIWRARIAAVLGEQADAVNLLRQAFDEGLWPTIALHRDRDLESLRHLPSYQAIVRPQDDDWQPPGGSRDQLLMVLIGVGMLGAVLVWFIGRARADRAAPAR